MKQPFLVDKILDQLWKSGYAHVSSAFSNDFLEQLEAGREKLQQLNYSLQNLREHSVYLSDQTPNRISHAMMISRGGSPLPYLVVEKAGAISEFLGIYEEVLEACLKVDLSKTRTMLNSQECLGSSKPVPSHFDGEYFQFDKKLDGYHLDVYEALVARFVMLVTLFNYNQVGPGGVVLMDCETDRKFYPSSVRGDLLVFDNTRFQHFVPSLPRPRKMIGLRNFDVHPLHFVQRVADQREDLTYLPTKGGWFGSGIDAILVQRQFLESDWPSVWEKTLKMGAAF